MTTAGQDGERLVTAEVVECAFLARLKAEETAFCGPDAMRAALVAVAPDLDRAGYDRARRECAEELWTDRLVETTAAKVHAAWMGIKRQQGLASRLSEWGEEQMVRGTVRAVFAALADEWSSSGCAPAGEEEQR